MPNGLIDKAVLVKELASGKTKAESARLAGSKASNLTLAANQVLQANPKLVVKLEKIAEEKIIIIKDALSKHKINKESAHNLVKMMEALQRIRNLEEGRPTEITALQILTNDELMDRARKLLEDQVMIKAPEVIDVMDDRRFKK